MKTLDAPVYEVKQNSEWYKQKVKQMESQDNFFKEMNEKYMIDNGFVYYHSEYFGIQSGTKDYETYKNELKKNPDKNGIYIFKVRSKHYPIFKEMISRIEKISPFKSYDTFGLNNARSSQWIGDRWFYSVRNEELIKSHDEIVKIDYKEYLNLIVDTLDKNEEDSVNL